MKARDYYERGHQLRDTLPPDSIPSEADGMVEAIQRAALAHRTGILVEESPRLAAVGGEHERT